MAKCVLFVEGSQNTNNGDLRNGFGKLLAQAGRPMPQIIMSDDTAGAVRKFRLEVEKTNSRFQQVLLLVDLDGPEEARETWLTAQELLSHREQVFFMVQKMEAWFLAQPDVLHEFYAPKLPHTLPGAPPARVPHPDRELVRCTRGHPKKGTYHKTAHGARLLALLRLPDLQRAFPDVARLAAAL